mmetsp:Transcript_73527/g.204289  ORF Transcript_73527/g.204289 Transcript_73527/m.204289 type:complete len:240 (+) Transcript_73527:917-1636(+)
MRPWRRPESHRRKRRIQFQSFLRRHAMRARRSLRSQQKKLRIHPKSSPRSQPRRRSTRPRRRLWRQRCRLQDPCRCCGQQWSWRWRRYCRRGSSRHTQPRTQAWLLRQRWPSRAFLRKVIGVLGRAMPQRSLRRRMTTRPESRLRGLRCPLRPQAEPSFSALEARPSVLWQAALLVARWVSCQLCSRWVCLCPLGRHLASPQGCAQAQCVGAVLDWSPATSRPVVDPRACRRSKAEQST